MLDDYERLFKRARARERRDEGAFEPGRYVRRTHQVYRARALRWCKRRTPTAIGVDGVRTVERERARRSVDAAGLEDTAAWRRGRAATRDRARSVREVLEVAVLAVSGE